MNASLPSALLVPGLVAVTLFAGWNRPGYAEDPPKTHAVRQLPGELLKKLGGANSSYIGAVVWIRITDGEVIFGLKGENGLKYFRLPFQPKNPDHKVLQTQSLSHMGCQPAFR